MAGHDVRGIAAQEISEGIVGIQTIAQGYDMADNGPDGEDAHVRFLLAVLRKTRGHDTAVMTFLERWERRWLVLDARADRSVLKGAAETVDVLQDALGHVERVQRPALALVA